MKASKCVHRPGKAITALAVTSCSLLLLLSTCADESPTATGTPPASIIGKWRLTSVRKYDYETYDGVRVYECDTTHAPYAEEYAVIGDRGYSRYRLDSAGGCYKRGVWAYTLDRDTLKGDTALYYDGWSVSDDDRWYMRAYSQGDGLVLESVFHEKYQDSVGIWETEYVLESRRYEQYSGNVPPAGWPLNVCTGTVRPQCLAVNQWYSLFARAVVPLLCLNPKRVSRNDRSPHNENPHLRQHDEPPAQGPARSRRVGHKPGNRFQGD